MVLQGLHVLFGILWFGAAVYNMFVVTPAIDRVDRVHADAFLVQYGHFAKRFIAPVAILTILSGIVLGFPLAAWSDLGYAYGNTYLAALVVALATWTWGTVMIGGNIEKAMRLEQGSSAWTAVMDRLKTYSALELLGFLVLFGFMVALRFHY
jgi:uncharacterized membrane protein YfbV (UPF0208 family)